MILMTILIGSYAQAGQLISLPNPPAPALYNLHWGYCAAESFSADGTHILGVCQYSFGASAGRYRSSPTVSYNVSWNLDGSVNPLGSQCNASYAYVPGGCSRNYQGTDTVYMYNGVPYYYVGSNSLGDTLLNSNVQSYLLIP